MRALACALLLVAGCSRDRPFDERYNDTEAWLEQRAAAIEANLAEPEPPRR